MCGVKTTCQELFSTMNNNRSLPDATARHNTNSKLHTHKLLFPSSSSLTPLTFSNNQSYRTNVCPSGKVPLVIHLHLGSQDWASMIEIFSFLIVEMTSKTKSRALSHR